MARKIFKSRREIVVTVLVLAGLAWLLDAWLTAPPPNWRDACGAGSGRVVDEAVCAYRTDPAFRKTVDLAAAGTPAKTDADRVATWMRAADDDPYRDMDGGATRDPAALMRDLAAFVPGITEEEARRAAVVGRNNWVVWTAGNDRFWDVLANRSFGNLDLLKVISNAPNLRFNRDNRWKYLGLVNEPCFRKPTGPRRDRFGLWLDERDPNCPADPFENQEKYPGVKIGARGKTVEVGSLYGWGTGIVGLRLFPNPDFDEAAAAKWDWFRYYNDPTYYTDRNLVRPYRVGMSCGFCHVGPSPTNPPADPNAPEWSNLSSNPEIGRAHV